MLQRYDWYFTTVRENKTCHMFESSWFLWQIVGVFTEFMPWATALFSLWLASKTTTRTYTSGTNARVEARVEALFLSSLTTPRISARVLPLLRLRRWFSYLSKIASVCGTHDQLNCYRNVGAFQQWSASIFSSSYLCTITHSGHRNLGIDHQRWIVLIFNQVLPNSSQWTVWRPVWRICIKMPGLNQEMLLEH